MDIKSGANSGKTTRDDGSFILKVLVVFILVAGAGYTAYLKGHQDGKAVGSVTTQSTQENAGDSEQKSNIEDEKNPASFEQGTMKVISNKEQTSFEVWNFGNKIGEIKSEGPITVSIWREFGGEIYLGVNPDGIGGYIVFSGPQEVYKADDTSLTKIYSGKGKYGFASDIILPGGNFTSDINLPSKLIAVEDTSTDEQKHPSIVVYDIGSQKSQSYPVSAPYGVAGAAHFSQTGDRIIYEAAKGIPEDEQYAMYMIDLATGKQTQIGGIETLQ